MLSLSVSSSSSYSWWRMAGYAGKADAGHAGEPCGGVFGQMGLWEGPVEIDERKCSWEQHVKALLLIWHSPLAVFIHYYAALYVNIWVSSNGQPSQIWTSENVYNTEWITSVSSWLMEVKLERNSMCCIHSTRIIITGCLVNSDGFLFNLNGTRHLKKVLRHKTIIQE